MQNAPRVKTPPTARPISVLTGKTMEKVQWGPNWEDDLAGEFEKRSKDALLEGVQKDMVAAFENTFLMYLPRLCEHCLNPACVASCPSGSIYKREDDGIVLIDQDKCRGWRMCISGCPFKKIYYNWASGKAEKCIFCYPRIEAGMPTVCSETCVGRIRYLGVMLYDADKIEQAASTKDPQELYQAQLDLFLDPADPEVQREALRQGLSQSWLDAAVRSPVYKMAMKWKVAFPLHPEYRTLPMVWYIPPLSPIQSALESGMVGKGGIIPSMDEMRIPLRYLANLLTAGKVEPIKLALERMIAMRRYIRGKVVYGKPDEAALAGTGLTPEVVEDMYQIMAIANFEDRFVVPSSHKEMVENAFMDKASCGFSFGNGCSDGDTKESLFGRRKESPIIFFDRRADIERNRRMGVH